MNRPQTPPHANQPSIAIIGAGLGGICMAIKLREAGYRDFTLYEKANAVGGTWRDNVYPGIACDVPSHLYSYSFETNPDWSRVYSPGWEIQQYAERCADKYGIRANIRLNSEIVECAYSHAGWQLTTTDGNSYKADLLISGMGGLHLPRLPQIKGQEHFAGETFHSARWNSDTDLRGKRVAIIGSAASAVQIVPAIANDVDRLYVFQRTPNWIIPHGDHAFSGFTKWSFKHVPGAGRLYRWFLFWLAESRWPTFRLGSLANRIGRQWALWHLRRQMPDQTLRVKLTPDYDVGCKRILRSDNYYPTLARDNVELVTDAIESVDTDTVVTSDGQRRVVDVIVYATGFDVFNVTGRVDIKGSHGRSLAQCWSSRIAAHRTVTVPGFPNFFMLQGPNSGLGHNSVIFMLESQVRYIIQCIDQMRARGWRSLEPKADEYERYQTRLSADLAKTIWQGCRSWYQDASGHVFTLWPHTAIRYWREMRRVNMDEFRCGEDEEPGES